MPRRKNIDNLAHRVDTHFTGSIWVFCLRQIWKPAMRINQSKRQKSVIFGKRCRFSPFQNYAVTDNDIISDPGCQFSTMIFIQISDGNSELTTPVLNSDVIDPWCHFWWKMTFQIRLRLIFRRTSDLHQIFPSQCLYFSNMLRKSPSDFHNVNRLLQKHPISKQKRHNAQKIEQTEWKLTSHASYYASY